MAESSRLGLLSAAFLGALVSASALAESGGVHVRAEYDPGLRSAVPKVDFSYHCADAGGTGSIEPGGNARHCPRAMEASVTAHDVLRIGAEPVLVETFYIHENDGTQCPSGQGTVWTLVAEIDDGAAGRIAAHARQESECRD